LILKGLPDGQAGLNINNRGCKSTVIEMTPLRGFKADYVESNANLFFYTSEALKNKVHNNNPYLISPGINEITNQVYPESRFNVS
jgi:hypothetical protein